VPQGRKVNSEFRRARQLAEFGASQEFSVIEAPHREAEVRVSGISAAAEGITNPPIDELLERTGSKYALVIVAAKRARQINAYYSQLGEGLLEYVGPMVETAPQEKALSISLREINSDLIEFKPSEA
jgi:DNA-directed RNA polymerase subunit omega